jgi:predicted transcriptional regulator of viral defense system
MYNNSMNVNNLSPIEVIHKILQEQNGLVRTSDLAEFGVPRNYLSILVKRGVIEKIERGVYMHVNAIPDEMAAIQARYKIAIFSHETALYLLQLTDRTPLTYSLTVPGDYNASSLKENNIKVYFVNRNKHPVGITTINSPNGNKLSTYNLERTICDIVRNRNQMDAQLLNEAYKRYVVHSERDITQLYEYAKIFRVQKKIRDIIEVLL